MAKYIIVAALALFMGAFLTAAKPLHHMERRQDESSETSQTFLDEFLSGFDSNYDSAPPSQYENQYFVCRLTALMKLSQNLVRIHRNFQLLN